MSGQTQYPREFEPLADMSPHINLSWCKKCGCGNDAAGWAHLPSCPDPTVEELRKQLVRQTVALSECHKEIAKLRCALMCDPILTGASS